MLFTISFYDLTILILVGRFCMRSVHKPTVGLMSHCGVTSAKEDNIFLEYVYKMELSFMTIIIIIIITIIIIIVLIFSIKITIIIIIISIMITILIIIKIIIIIIFIMKLNSTS